MKKVLILVLILLVLFCAGCGLIDNSVEVETIESELHIDLSELTDDSVQAFFKSVDENDKGTVAVRLQLEGAAQTLDAQLSERETWHPMPMDSGTFPFLSELEFIDFDFDSIRSGFWTVNVMTEEGLVSWDPSLVQDGYTYKIGFWDSSSEYLYYISFTP